MKLLKDMFQQNKGINQEIGKSTLQETGNPVQESQREVPDDVKEKFPVTEGCREGSLWKVCEK